MNGWVLAYDGFDPPREGLREALCTLGNGYMSVRGAAPEARADGVHYPGTYVAGCWNRLRDDVGGMAVDNESMVNLPNWLPLTLAVGEADWLDMARVEVLAHRLELDLRHGVLRRHLRFRDVDGNITQVAQRRLVHMASPHLAALECTVLAENWSGLLRVRSGIDGRVQNTGVPRYRDLASAHLVPVAQSAEVDVMTLTVDTSQSHTRVAVGAATRVLRDGVECDVERSARSAPGLVELDLAVHLVRGQEVTVEKVVAVHTSRSWAVSEPTEAVAVELAGAGDVQTLRRAHELAWSHLWGRFGIAFTGGGPSSRTIPLAARVSMFHLLQSVSTHTAEADAGVPARGLHGEAYRGHVFWDELFVLPVLTLRDPALTRALLEYRQRRLPAARRAAHAAGLGGALYPWQSGSDGSEVSQRVHLNPVSGRWLADVSSLQRHVGLAVAYTAWHYVEVSGDLDYLEQSGAELILEIARCWAGLAQFEPELGRFVVRNVMGPDEFHTGYPGSETAGIDNNAYTNVMAVWVLRRALDVLELLPAQRREELIRVLAITPDETTLWRHITSRMFVPFHSGVISQFEGFGDLEDLDWEEYRQRYGNIQRLDRILEAEGRSVNEYQVCKQADVLMLFYLLTADELRDLLLELGYILEPETIRRTIDYYLGRTSHGSTLSSLVHAWVLARANREHSLAHLTLLLESDLADVQGGTTAEGIHLAAMAGSIDLLQRCFTGLEARGNELRFNPRWPDELGTLAFRLRFRGHDVEVRISSQDLRVVSHGGRGDVVVSCEGFSQFLEPGGSVEFRLAPP